MLIEISLVVLFLHAVFPAVV
jgi:hypothetical protein